MTKEIQYKEFKGNAINQIPALIKSGYKQATMADVMNLRIEGKLKDVYVDTVDAVAYNKFGDIKIIRNSKYIKNLNKNSHLEKGALFLKGEEFENIIGKDILYLTKKEKDKINNKKYTKKSIKDSIEWNFLARDNSRLVKYSREIFVDMKEKFGIKKGMKFCFDFPSDFDKLRSIYMNKIEYKSNFVAWSSLDFNLFRFIGIKNTSR